MKKQKKKNSMCSNNGTPLCKPFWQWCLQTFLIAIFKLLALLSWYFLPLFLCKKIGRPVLCLSLSNGVFLGLRPWSPVWFSVQRMVLVETMTPDCSRLAFRSLDVWCSVFFHHSHQPSNTCLINFSSSPQRQGRFLTVRCLANFITPFITLGTVETGIPRCLEMALYPLEVLCLLIIALLMSSDSSFVFTIVTKEQGITDGFLKHGSHHSLAGSCHMGTDNVSQVILVWDLPQVSSIVFLPLFIVLNCCLSFALLCQTRVLYSKVMFHFFFFLRRFSTLFT